MAVLYGNGRRDGDSFKPNESPDPMCDRASFFPITYVQNAYVDIISWA